MTYSPEFLIQKIAHLQSTGRSEQPGFQYFPAGLFPSYRLNPAWVYHRPDTNVFFTAITVFTLQRLRPFVAESIQQVTDDITNRAVGAYEQFRNKDGLKTYNFYQTRPSQHFPHGYVFRHLEHFRIPDDVDDTAMVYLTTQPTREELLWLKQKLPQHANGTRLTIRNTFPEYKSLRAYSTWFGKNMPIEFDACALSNLLYCILHYNLPLNGHDEDSFAFLRSIVETDRYRTDPFRCAHNYARTSLIIYHLSRLIAQFDPPQLQGIQAKLVNDAFDELDRVENRLEKMLLVTSLLQLGETGVPTVPLENIQNDFSGFHFFIAGMLSAYEHTWLYRWANRSFWHIRWQCEAYNWALVLEYVILRQAHTAL